MTTPGDLETGSDHVLRLHLPGNAPEGARFPVAWLLDAPTTWAPMQQALNESGRADEVVVVGVDWQGEGPVDQGLRRRDFTSPARGPVPPPRGGGQWGHDGDCARFLGLLMDRWQPQVLRELPVDPLRQVLVGHSLSGLFVLDALLERPDAFAGFVAASPSVWWDGARLLERVQAGDHRPLGCARVLVTVGSEEQRAGPEKPPSVAGGDEAATLGEAHMVDNASQVAELLGSRGADCRFRLFEGEGHGTVLPVAMAAALDLVLEAPPGGPRCGATPGN